LRSAEHPLGLPDLRQRLPAEAARVEAANGLYDFMTAAVHQLLERKIAWSIENPSSSWLWTIPSVAHLVQAPGVAAVFFHHCMHGGDRDKKT